jgi:hypothetical protein
MELTLQPKSIGLGLRVISLTNLIVEKKNVYGVERVYPVCKKAKLFARISGNKTLLDEDRKLIAELGYTFSTKAEEIK